MTTPTHPAPALDCDVDRLTRLLDALRDDHALDLVYDDVEIALGGVTPTPEQIAEFTPRLRRALAQLVTVARKRAANRPHAVTDAEIAAIKAANQVLADTKQAESPAESRAGVFYAAQRLRQICLRPSATSAPWAASPKASSTYSSTVMPREAARDRTRHSARHRPPVQPPTTMSSSPRVCTTNTFSTPASPSVFSAHRYSLFPSAADAVAVASTPRTSRGLGDP